MSPSPTHAENRRFPELDGMRAVAVVSVILFHCEMSGVLNAGFFGVDIFFTISGFIITAILLKEWRETDNIGFSHFYFRRLKRLLPPVLVLVGVAYAVTSALSREAQAWLEADLPAALSYLSNVWQIHAGQSYFDTTPHVLKHLWSLAVEEQFYLVWPLFVWLALRSRASPRTLGVIALLLAAASTVWMGYLYDLDIDATDQNRLYLGTDTHAMGLLAGAALACFWNPWATAILPGKARHGWRVAAVLAIALLGYMLQVLNPADPAMYRGCFLMVPVLTCVILYATTTDPRFALSWLLRTSVFQWLGKRSYSLYLVHWPVFVWLRLLDYKDFTDPATLAGALGLVLVCSAILYACVEAPTTAFRPRFSWGWMGAASAVYTLAAWSFFIVTASAWDSHKAAQLADMSAKAKAEADAAVVAALALVEPAPVVPAVPGAAPAAAVEAPDHGLDTGEKISGGADIFAIGDSVLLGSSAYLSKKIPGIQIDAAVGRQASNGLKVIQEWVSQPQKATTVIVHLGTNGYINEGQFKELLGALAGLQHVFVINVHADRRWTAPNNEIIERTVHAFPNVALIDWHGVSEQRPEYFVSDGIHLTKKGILALTAQIKLATGGEAIPPDPVPAPNATPVLADAAGTRAQAHKVSLKEARAAKRAARAAAAVPAAAPVPPAVTDKPAESPAPASVPVPEAAPATPAEPTQQ
jgi:peptidoglycan/LPS O-acetylase OafA/YrhL